MKDSYGRKIKVGDLVEKIVTRGAFDGAEYSCGFVTPYEIIEIDKGIIPIKNIWIVSNKYKIIEGNCYFPQNDTNRPSLIGINCIEMFLATQPNEILKIVDI